MYRAPAGSATGGGTAGVCAGSHHPPDPSIRGPKWATYWEWPVFPGQEGGIWDVAGSKSTALERP
jgi:hypothetical protein